MSGNIGRILSSVPRLAQGRRISTSAARGKDAVEVLKSKMSEFQLRIDRPTYNFGTATDNMFMMAIAAVGIVGMATTAMSIMRIKKYYG